MLVVVVGTHELKSYFTRVLVRRNYIEWNGLEWNLKRRLDASRS